MATGAFRTANATVSAHKGVAITPSDSTVFPVTRAIYVGVTGNIVVVHPDETTTVTYSNVPVGIFPIQVQQVYSTGTTATTMIALY